MEAARVWQADALLRKAGPGIRVLGCHVDQVVFVRNRSGLNRQLRESQHQRDAAVALAQEMIAESQAANWQANAIAQLNTELRSPKALAAVKRARNKALVNARYMAKGGQTVRNILGVTYPSGRNVYKLVSGDVYLPPTYKKRLAPSKLELLTQIGFRNPRRPSKRLL